MIIDKAKLIFIHIGKTGGTSIEYMLREKYQCLETDYFTDKHAQHEPVLNLITRCPKYIPYFKFAIVRNPYSRIISSYKFACQGLDKKRAFDIVPRREQFYYRKFYDNYKPTYDGFIFWIRHIYNKFMIYYEKYGLDVYRRNFWDKHFEKDKRGKKFDGFKIIQQSQTRFIYDNNNNLLVNQVLKLENLDTDWKLINNKYKIGKLIHVNKNKFPKCKISANNLPYDVKKMIYMMFKQDFKNFGYDQ